MGGHQFRGRGGGEFLVENHLDGSPVEVVVGIPSYNEADSISYVVEQVAEGLKQHLPGFRTAIINADNHSPDGTREVFLASPSRGIPKVYLSTPPGVKGKGNNFRNLFRYLRPYRPKAVVVVDADLRSITPAWPRRLVEPILEGYDFAAPVYSRNEYDGTITNHICYPLVYALLGKNIRQPIGGDFAFSGRLMEAWLARPWKASHRQYGVDIFMTMGALTGDFRLAQVFLGVKIHKPSAPKLGPMFVQVVDTLFGCLLAEQKKWGRGGGKPETPRVFGRTRYTQPQPLGVDYKFLKQQALRGYPRARERIQTVLPEKLLRKVEGMYDSGRLRLSAGLWVQIVHSFLRAYTRSTSRRERLQVVGALRPLYFGRVVSFIRETLDLDHLESEVRIKRQAEMFHRHRRRFLELLRP